MAINTIGGLIEHHIRLTAWCNACRHYDQLDLDALAASWASTTRRCTTI